MLLFCDSGFSPREVDYLYAEEYAAAQQCALPTALVSFEALQKGRVAEALRYVPQQEQPTEAIYRGWMLRPALYARLYQALLEAKNIRLINDPDTYQWAHHLPENYAAIADHTPKSTWGVLEGHFEVEDWATQLAPFGDQPILVKDYVKSQKHYWSEACYIPDASDREQVAQVVQRFLELQGDDLNVGLVFRAFVPLVHLTEHSQSGMPLTKEFRLFVFKGQVLGAYPYWGEGKYDQIEPFIQPFEDLIQTLPSNFYTLDIAQTQAGEWLIVELGDAQVSGLPDRADPLAWYQKLRAYLENGSMLTL